MEKNYNLIIGANSTIAKSVIELLKTHPSQHLIVIYRHSSQAQQLATIDNVTAIEVEDYQPCQIDHAIFQLPKDIQGRINFVFICIGILHDNSCFPEKRIEELTSDNFTHVMNINALTPIIWLQRLTPLVNGKTPCKVVVFSARVGSISDNHLGGWYSYRASKAALNMMLKNVAIEYARRAKNVKLIAFHPGTTNSPLSKPFQKNVPKDKLFRPEFVAKQLLTILENTVMDNQLSYVDWKHENISF